MNSTYNNNSIGIEICVNPDSDFKKAVQNAADLIKYLMKKHNISSGNVVQHNAASGKDCPHFLRNGRKGVTWNDLKKAIASSSGNVKPTGGSGSSGGSSSRNYLQNGDKGAAVKTMQQDLIKAGYKLPKFGADSHFGDESEKAVREMQKKNGLVIDGLYGTASKNALKKENKAGSVSKPSSGSSSTKASGSLKSKVNGLRYYNKPSWKDKDVFGRINKGNGFPTIVEKVKVGNSYQYKVKNSKGKTFYITASPKYVTVSEGSSSSNSSKKKTGANLTVDGKWGNNVTKALQRALGTPVDGVISKQPRNAVTQAFYGSTIQFGNGSSNVVVALQKKIGVTADGRLGPATIRALQKYLGTPQDGVLSRPSTMVRELQRRLNAGTF